MKKIIVGLLLMVTSLLNATWKIGNIKNHSDLKLTSASYIKPKKKKIGRLTKILMQSKNQQNIAINYTVSDSSKGCSLIEASNGFEISFDDNPSHAIHWARAKTKSNKKQLGKEACDVSKYHYCARVFLEKEGDQAPLFYAAHGYNQENSKFDIVISGSTGNYIVSLKSVWD